MSTENATNATRLQPLVGPNQVDVDANLAKTIWVLYLRHGLGEYNNWLTMKKDHLERAEVVAGLRFPHTRQAAENTIRGYRQKITEIEQLLDDAK